MPAPRRATHLLLVNGAFDHNPNRRRTDPKPRAEVGSAPRQVAVTFKKAWDYIVSCAPEGVLADRDRIYLEIAATLFAEFRAAPAKFHPAKLARLEMMLSKLGMSPADASRVSASTPFTPGDFDD